MGTRLWHDKSSSITILHHLPLLGVTMRGYLKEKHFDQSRHISEDGCAGDRKTVLETTKCLTRFHPLANKSSIQFAEQEPEPRKRKDKLLYHTGIHQLHPHSLSDRRTATRWRCSSHSDRRSGPPRTSAHGELGREATKPHDSTGTWQRLSLLSLPVTPKTKITLAIKDAFHPPPQQ